MPGPPGFAAARTPRMAFDIAAERDGGVVEPQGLAARDAECEFSD